jgi:hypothetical protein
MKTSKKPSNHCKENDMTGSNFPPPGDAVYGWLESGTVTALLLWYSDGGRSGVLRRLRGRGRSPKIVSFILAIGKAMKPDQIAAMTRDTQELLATQKSLVSMLDSFAPLMKDMGKITGFLGSK